MHPEIRPELAQTVLGRHAEPIAGGEVVLAWTVSFGSVKGRRIGVGFDYFLFPVIWSLLTVNTDNSNYHSHLPESLGL